MQALRRVGFLSAVGCGLYIAPFLPRGKVCFAAATGVAGSGLEREKQIIRALDSHANGIAQNQPATRLSASDGQVHASRSAASQTKLSIVIPVYNEGRQNLAHVLSLLSKQVSAGSIVEVIVVDGGCKDDTMEAVRPEEQSEYRNLTIATTTSSGVGRGPALNTGAELATGEHLLFLHADTTLPKDFDVTIADALEDNNTIMTAFTFAIKQNIRSTIPESQLRFVEGGTSRRSRFLWLPYGDQAYALRLSTFRALGQFPSFKMMEDFEFVSRARDVALMSGKQIAILPEKSFCSSRRWEKQGVLKTTLLNWLFVAAYTCAGKSPDWVFERYYGMKS